MSTIVRHILETFSACSCRVIDCSCLVSSYQRTVRPFSATDKLRRSYIALACRAVIFPTSQKHGHPFALRIMLPVDYPEPEALARDSNAARTFIQDLIERKDVTLGEFTYLSVYRFVDNHTDMRI
jgi:hypothetical protein